MSFGRRIITGTGAITVANGVGRVVAIAAAPVLTRWLGPSAYGVAAIVGTSSALTGTVALLGIDMSYARFYFGGLASSGLEVERFCWRFAATSAAIGSVLAIIIWSVLLAPITRSPASLGVLVGITGFLTVIGTMAQARIRLQGRYSALALALVLSGIVTSATTLVLAYAWRRDAWSLLIGSAVGSAAVLGLLGIPSFRVLARSSRLDSTERRALVALGVPGAGTALMYWVISSSDRWFIAYFRGAEAVGSYTFAAGVGLLGLMLNGAIVTVWFPESSRIYVEDSIGAPVLLGRMWTRLVVVLGIVWLGVTMSGGDVIRLVADVRFHSASAYIPWIAGGACFYGIAQLSGTGLLLSRNMRPVVAWWLAGTCLSIGLNFIMVPRIGALASALTMCTTFAFIAAGVMFSSQQRLPLAIPLSLLLRVAVLLLVAGALGCMQWDRNPLISLSLKLPVGAITALIAAYGVAPDWVVRGWQRLRLTPLKSS